MATPIENDLNSNNYLIINYGDTIIRQNDVTVPDPPNYINITMTNEDNYVINTFQGYPIKDTLFNYIATNWTVTKMYIYPYNANYTHDASKFGVSNKVTPIGELVIEHANSTNNSITYNCFFLISGAASLGLDKIIQYFNDANVANPTIMQTVNININKLMLQTDTNNPIANLTNDLYMYNDKNNIVLVNSLPIPVTSKMPTIDKGFVFPITTRNPSAKYKIPSFVYGTTLSDQIYIDCNPTGVSNDDIQTYKVPISSDYTLGAAKTDYQKTTTNFYIFTLFVIAAYFIIPTAYRQLIIVNISKYNDKKNKLLVADVLIGISIIILTSVLFGSGDYDQKTWGVFILVVTFMSIPLITSKRLDKEYLKGVPDVYNNITLSNILNILGEYGEPFIRSKTVSIFFFIIFLIMVSVSFAGYYLGFNTKSLQNKYPSILIALLLGSVLTMLTVSSLTNNDNLESAFDF